MRSSRVLQAAAAACVAVSLVFAQAAAGRTPRPKPERKNPCTCKDLPKMERELFEQEFLQREFYSYLLERDASGKYKPPPTPAPGETGAKALAQAVGASLGGQAGSSAGGGGAAGGARPFLEFDFRNCELKIHKVTKLVRYKKGGIKSVETKPFPFNEKEEAKLRKTTCDQLLDSFLEHEDEHLKQCNEKGDSTRFNVESWSDSARWEVQGYDKGIKNLRASIAQIASDCGWGGSTNPDGSKNLTKKNLRGDSEVAVVPTLAEAKRLAKALAGGKRP